jgi:NAD(P)-dependent dehydrogenase (short-subunit alcohol dehydrogenase family)
MNVLDQFRLDGRVAVVTGGSRGLGKVMAEALASAGASVVVTARTVESAQAAAGEIASSTGAKTLALAAEMLRSDQIQRMVDQTLDTFGSLDILVNNAGINRRGPIEELTEADFDEVIGINLKGPWLCCRAASKPMKAKGWGRVINLSSMMAEISLPGRTPYCSSKGGLSMMTKTLALEWAKDGITVNNICPGPFATEMNVPLLNDPQVRETFTSKIPLGRWGDPRELGPVAVFLASEASSFVTGASIFVDGGYTAQ